MQSDIPQVGLKYERMISQWRNNLAGGPWAF